MIYFQTRQEKIINCMFSLYDGLNLDNLDRYQQGDFVDIIFEITKEQSKAIDKTKRFCSIIGNKYYFQIPLKVAKRKHCFSNDMEKPQLRRINMSIVLESLTQEDEEILLWICLNEKPKWAVA